MSDPSDVDTSVVDLTASESPIKALPVELIDNSTGVVDLTSTAASAFFSSIDTLAGSKRRLETSSAVESDAVIDLSKPAVFVPMKKTVVDTPPPPKVTLSCPICLETVSRPTSTKCGHIFCEVCIRNAVMIMKKCPVCKESLSKTMIHRIYI